MNNVEIQRAIYTLLTTSSGVFDLVTGVFDEVPQKQRYPYIVIGEDTGIQWDGDEFVGTNATITLHVWGRQPGRREVKTIMDSIYDALHRADIVITGMNTVLCQWEFSETFMDSDGVTRHGVTRYRIIAEQEATV